LWKEIEEDQTADLEKENAFHWIESLRFS